MARQWRLTVPIVVTVGAMPAETYDLVRFTNPIRFNLDGTLVQQGALFGWSLGKVVGGVFVQSSALTSCLWGTKEYTNTAGAFTTLIAGDPAWTALQDRVFADLVVDGCIGAGAAENYSI